MKLAIVGDIHISDVPPTSRTDDYRETIFKKLSFIREYCNNENVSTVLLLGDVFHRKNPNLNSHDTVRRLISLFSGFSAKVVEVPGNHDISMTSKNLGRQPLAVLEEAGAISIIGFPYTKNFVFSTACFDLYGMGFAEVNDTLSENYESINEHILDSSKFNILCLHQMVLPDGESFFGDFINFAELAQLDFDAFCVGHYHPGFNPPVQQKHGKFFINPGAISRGSLDVHNIDRVPLFVILDISNAEVRDFYTVEIPHAPSSSVFDLQKVKSSLVARKEIDSFTSSLKDAIDSNVDISSIEGLSSVIKDITGGDKEIINFIEPFLSKAKELLDTK